MLECLCCHTGAKELIAGLCRSCYARWWHKSNAEKCHEYTTAYRNAHRQELRDKANKRTQMLKLEVIANYGRVCACCGEGNPAFLTVDHVNGGGNIDRRSDHGGWRFYARLKRQGFPQGLYRILCYNCNLAIGFFGRCPHEDARVKGSLTCVPDPFFEIEKEIL